MKYPFELISLHIPKSAGTSFRLILQDVYGEDAVQRLDINKQDGILLNQESVTISQIPAGLKVAHGHFSYSEFKQFFGEPQAPIITWLRNPVARVVSQYYFLQERFEDQVIHSRNSRNVFKRLCRSLEEFAAVPGNRNLQSRYLQGLRPEDLDFIGIVEFFEEDLQELAGKMGWETYEPIHDNKTRNKEREEVSPDVLRLIADLNSEDLSLYETVLSLRNKTLKGE
jgi:hypothetical protein